MSTFKFNFSGEESNEPKEESPKEDIQWLESEEVIPNKQIDKLDDIVAHAKMFVQDNVEIGYVTASEALLNMNKQGLNTEAEIADKQNSDLVPGKYEGGLQIWECTYNLIEYINKEQDIELNGSKVLDLGCGAGVLGIFAFLKGSNVTFQDYNKEVLEYVTIPNVLLNIEEEKNRPKEIKRCKFYSGDWASFNQTLSVNEVYDIIFTAETIYNTSNYNKLIELFLKRLSKNGVVYVAAKKYYFGVGGGTDEFMVKVDNTGLLKCEVCYRKPINIVKEILKITWK